MQFNEEVQGSISFHFEKIYVCSTVKKGAAALLAEFTLLIFPSSREFQ